MTLHQAVQEDTAIKDIADGLLEPLFPPSAFRLIWRYETKPRLTFYLATGARLPNRMPPTEYLEIWTPAEGFELFPHYRDNIDQVDKPGWRLDVISKGIYTTVQCLAILADVVELYRQHRTFSNPGRVQCYYSKR